MSALLESELIYISVNEGSGSSLDLEIIYRSMMANASINT